MIKITKKKYKAIVTFTLKTEANRVYLKGEWNNWKELKMKKKKDGNFYIRVAIPFGKWEFGYLIDEKWVIEDNLEKVQNPFGGFNNLLEIKE